MSQLEPLATSPPEHPGASPPVHPGGASPPEHPGRTRERNPPSRQPRWSEEEELALAGLVLAKKPRASDWSGIAAALGTGRSANAVQQHYEILAGIRFSRHQAQDWAVDRRAHQPANLAVAYAVPLPAPQPQPQPQPQPLQPEPEPPQPLSVAPAASSAGQRSRLRPHSAPPTGQAATAAPAWPRGGTGPLAVYATDPVSGDPRGAALHTLNSAATAAIYANIIFAQPWAQARAGAAAAGVGLPTALLASTPAASPSPLALPDQHAGRACQRCGTTTTPKWRWSLARPRRTPPLHHPTRCPEYTLLASPFGPSPRRAGAA